MSRRPDQLAAELNAHRNAFKAFLAARVGSEAEAEDILQNGLLKALQRAGELHDGAKLTAWFYQLLRSAIVDHYRTRGSARRRHASLGETIIALGEDIAAAPKGWEAQLCGCLGGVVETLPPKHAELLRRVNLNSESVQDAARAMKMTPNNASVTLHRARKDLRARLETFCGDCAERRVPGLRLRRTRRFPQPRARLNPVCQCGRDFTSRHEPGAVAQRRGVKPLPHYPQSTQPL